MRRAWRWWCRQFDRGARRQLDQISAALLAQAAEIEVETKLLRDRNERNQARLDGMAFASQMMKEAIAAGDAGKARAWTQVHINVKSQWEYSS